MGVFDRLIPEERPAHRPFCGCEGREDSARVLLFGAPFDSTTSFRPGARFAPPFMRRESWGLETYSPTLDMDLDNGRVHDAGDLELPFGSVRATLDIVARVTGAICDAGKIPLMLGGEHSLTFGAVRAVAERVPEVHVVHLDAHTDLRDDYLGVRDSHACVMRRVADLIGPSHVHSFGIRSGLRAEFDWASAHIDFHPFSLADTCDLADRLDGAPVYLTIDLDVLDPSVFPGTGTPEPGGVNVSALLEALVHLTRTRIVAADLMELAPTLDPTGASTAVACKVLRELLILLTAD